MVTRRRVPATAATLSPFPEGWYFVATRQAVLKDKLIQRTWMGENVIVWCDDNGRVCVAEAVCPHLGADLGPAAGGCVRDGRLLCPFHGYEFDATGQCVATPFAEPPRTAKLRVFETQEILGLIFAWWGIDGREPQWSLPVGYAGRGGLEQASRSAPSAFRATHRRRPRTPWTWPTCATSTATTTWSPSSRRWSTATYSRPVSTSRESGLSPVPLASSSTCRPAPASMDWATRSWISARSPLE